MIFCNFLCLFSRTAFSATQSTACGHITGAHCSCSASWNPSQQYLPLLTTALAAACALHARKRLLSTQPRPTCVGKAASCPSRCCYATSCALALCGPLRHQRRSCTLQQQQYGCCQARAHLSRQCGVLVPVAGTPDSDCHCSQRY
jgi:hypothetical protein